VPYGAELLICPRTVRLIVWLLGTRMFKLLNTIFPSDAFTFLISDTAVFPLYSANVSTTSFNAELAVSPNVAKSAVPFPEKVPAVFESIYPWILKLFSVLSSDDPDLTVNPTKSTPFAPLTYVLDVGVAPMLIVNADAVMFMMFPVMPVAGVIEFAVNAS